MTELEASIGRVQLRKLPTAITRRRSLVAQIRERIADLETVRVGKVIEGAESSYWFIFIWVDVAQLTVPKERFAEALAAEGIPAQASYDHIAYEAPWLRDRQTLGSSGYPWSAFPHSRDLDYRDSCPNARQAIDRHLMVYLHEGWSEREVDDLATALRKVERAYLK